MTLTSALIGLVLSFGAGELYALYRQNQDRRTLWMCVTGLLIAVLNLLVATGNIK